MADLVYSQYSSLIGDLQIVTDAGELCYVDFDDCKDRLERFLQRRHEKRLGAQMTLNDCRAASLSLTIKDAFDGYFAKQPDAFDALLCTLHGTDFQRTVWHALSKIRFGQNLSYGELAQKIGRPKAVRAVANANANNPVAIIIPCHRVIAGTGHLAGYSGGVERKRWLLKHENIGFKE